MTSDFYRQTERQKEREGKRASIKTKKNIEKNKTVFARKKYPKVDKKEKKNVL